MLRKLKWQIPGEPLTAQHFRNTALRHTRSNDTGTLNFIRIFEDKCICLQLAEQWLMAKSKNEPRYKTFSYHLFERELFLNFAHRVHAFHMILRINSDYFINTIWFYLCNGHMVSFMWRMEVIFRLHGYTAHQQYPTLYFPSNAHNV